MNTYEQKTTNMNKYQQIVNINRYKHTSTHMNKYQPSTNIN